MATTKPKSPVTSRAAPRLAARFAARLIPGKGRRRWPWLIVLAAAVLLAWFWTPLMGNARAGAAYGARVGCSCRFVAGRSLGDCRKDFEPGMGLVMLSEDPVAKSVTARFPLLAAQTATFREGPGCVLEPWDD